LCEPGEGTLWQVLSRTPRAYGSINFDSHSFSLNDEANLNISQVAFAGRQIAVFQQDVAQSRAMTLSDWRRRPFVEKVVEHAASLLRTQL
jgi:cardiolipin synthase